jgi:hypothetical protein
MIAMGYYDEQKTSSEQIRHPIDAIVSFNGYYGDSGGS